MGSRLSTIFPAGTLRAPIAESWRRAAVAGLSPESALLEPSQADVDLGSRLLSAAEPVLHELDERLRDTGMSTVLVDQDGHAVHRWCDGRSVATVLDTLGIEVGTGLAEDEVGTNAPGTALEIRSSIVVHGTEHYAEKLRGFSCYGHPIFNPTTRRLEGALDITTLATQANPLLAPLVAKAVADIEQRLLEGSRVSDQLLLAAFQAVCRRSRPVLALGDDLMLSNQAATDLLEGADIALLRNLAADLSTAAELDLELHCGQRATVRAERVSGTNSGVIMHLEALGSPRIPQPQTRDRRARSVAVPHLHVAGPPGSGRSTEGRDRAPQEPCHVLTGTEATLGGSAAWAERFATAVEAGTGTICVDGVDLLPVELVEAVASHAARRRAPHLVLTSGPVDRLDGSLRSLAALCDDTVELLPLAHRVPELGRITARMLEEMGCAETHHLTPGALRVLGAYSWPGNLTELRAVLETAVHRRSRGGVMPDDLPPALLADSAGPQLSPIERAERQAIIAALRTTEGNKLRAAQSLGISRTTLYARMRSLKVQTY